MKKFLLFAISILPQLSYCQGEYNVWFFGYGAGIDFNSGSAVAITGPINQWEGCADICDASGSVLFSTDGITVYDHNNNVMQAGLLGNPSSTQSGVITPFPGSTTKYYIFTADAQAGSNGIQYNIVDMTLNAGLGGVTIMNQPLLGVAAEKITAVRNANGTDIWVLVHGWNSNSFYAYPVTSAGVGSAVITNIGSVYPADPGDDTQAIGQMKASPDGHRVASSMSWKVNQPVEVFDFDNATGTLSNQIDLPTQGGCYGISFSPDNTKFYCAIGGIFGSAKVVQYDLSAGNIQASAVTLVTNNDDYGSVQIAPDGKVYIAKNGPSFLDVINNPNLAGAACGFVYDGFPLLAGSGMGLPNFIDSYVVTSCEVNLGSDTTLCGNFSLTLDADTGGVSYLWQDQSTLQTFTANGPGKYYVTVVYADGCVASDTISLDSSSVEISLGVDTILCKDNTILLTPGPGYQTYLWQDGSSLQTMTADSGYYSVTVTNEFGCKDSASINILTDEIKISLGPDTSSCRGSGIVLEAGNAFASYAWNDGSSSSTLITSAPGIYSVVVQDEHGCTATDSVLVSNGICNEIFVPNAFSPGDDAIDNTFGILNPQDVATLSMRIYNRWGELIFETSNVYERWDGTYKTEPCELGVYIFVINCVLKSNVPVIMNGNVTLVR
ncbi:MAG TPA: gliding motility-associated C-terminal domain-containing protein [Chitinophagales bacterium]|nr:gliding motility-associated C-terminal domain-containing protein [Chitinophagales bacterium]